MTFAPQPPPMTPPKKSGIPLIGWLGIGCGGLVLILLVMAIFGIVLAVKKAKEVSKNPDRIIAEMIMKTQPDYKIVSRNDARGEMTIQKKSGGKFTTTYKDVAKGRFLFDDLGNGGLTSVPSADLSQIPSWVPRFPDLSDVSVAQKNEKGKTNGFYVGTTLRSRDEIRSFLIDEAKKLGLNERTQLDLPLSPGSLTFTWVGSYTGPTRSLNVSLNGTGERGERILAKVIYSEK